MKNMTYAEAIDLAVIALGECEATDRLLALREQLAKRGSKHGMTKTQKENVDLRERMVEALANGGMTATELAKEMDISVQKASALLRQLVVAERVARVKEGKVIRFEVA